MKKSVIYSMALVMGVTLPLYQNFTGWSIDSIEKSLIKIPSTGPAVAVKPQTPSYSVEDIDLGRYGLIRSDTISILADPALAPPAQEGKTDADDRALGLSYAPYLSRTEKDVQKNDLFVITAVVELTHQPPISEKTVAHMASYVDCNNKAASPVVQKSLKRYAGNHHGSVNFTGVCHFGSVPASGVTVRLLAKSSLANGVIHGGAQTKLIVNQYRLLTGDQDSLNSFFPVATFSQEGTSRIQTSPKGVLEPKAYQSISVPVLVGDLLYLNTQVTSADANPEIPMFGLDLLVGSSRLMSATENVVSSELPRVSQTVSAMWRSRVKGDVVVGTKVTAAESVTSSRLSIIGSLSKLEGMVLRKGPGQDRKSLKQLLRISPNADLTLTANAVNVPISSTRSIQFDAPGILRVKSMANLQYGAADLQKCQTQIQIVSTAGAGVKALSMKNSKFFRSPYTYNSLSSEFIYTVKDPGTYKVDSFVLCESSFTKAPVTVLKNGTSSVIEVYEEN